MNPAEPTDAELARRFLDDPEHRDGEAFLQIYSRHRSAVREAMQAAGMSAAAAERRVGAVFDRFLGRRADYPPDKPLREWLEQLAREVAQGERKSTGIPARLRAWSIAPDAAFSVSGMLGGGAMLHTWRVLRSLALWIGEDCPAVPPFSGRGMEDLEAQILTSDYNESLRLPLAVIARALTPEASDANLSRLAYACLCVAEWALGRGLYPLATSFADASSFATGMGPHGMGPHAEVARCIRRVAESHACPSHGAE